MKTITKPATVIKEGFRVLTQSSQEFIFEFHQFFDTKDAAIAYAEPLIGKYPLGLLRIQRVKIEYETVVTLPNPANQ